MNKLSAISLSIPSALLRDYVSLKDYVDKPFGYPHGPCLSAISFG